MHLEFDAPLWRWKAREDGWFFVTVPLGDAEEIRALGSAAGFGSVKVTATIGEVTWSTSVFPDRESGSYVLPLKALVRKRNGLEDGDVAHVALEVHPPH